MVNGILISLAALGGFLLAIGLALIFLSFWFQVRITIGKTTDNKDGEKDAES